MAFRVGTRTTTARPSHIVILPIGVGVGSLTEWA